MLAQSSRNMNRLSPMVKTIRNVSSGDLRARAGNPPCTPRPQHQATFAPMQNNLNKSAMQQCHENICQEANSTSVKKEGAVHVGPTRFQPITSSKTAAEKDPFAKNKRSFSTFSPLMIKDPSTRGESLSAPKTDPRTAGTDLGSKIDEIKDKDLLRPSELKKHGGKKEGQPVGQVLGPDGVESVDGGKHERHEGIQHKAVKKDKVKNPLEWTNTSTGAHG